MAHKKGASSSRNGRDSNAQRLGAKCFGGQLGRTLVRFCCGDPPNWQGQ